jgi:hypothetical protein
MSNPLWDDGRMQTKRQTIAVQSRPESRSSRRMARGQNESTRAEEKPVRIPSSRNAAGEPVRRPAITQNDTLLGAKWTQSAGSATGPLVRPLYGSYTAHVRPIYGWRTGFVRPFNPRKRA